MKLTRCLLAALFAALTCGFAHAGEAIEPGEMELYPTLLAVGIEIPYEGDDDSDAAAGFVWRRAGGSQWHDGVEMTFDRARGVINASVWPLEQGEKIEVRVTFSDEGAEPTTIEGEVTTRTLVLENSEGAVYYVSPDGDDAGDGTRAEPFRTLAHAARVVEAGDTVYAMSGVYHEGDLFAGLQGERGKPIIFAAAPGETPVLDGSITIAKGAEWDQWGEGSFMYVDPETGYVGYVAQDGERMFCYPSPREFGEDSLEVGRSWHYDLFERHLFVRPGDGSAPADHEYKVAVHPHAALLSASRYVVLKGFEIRYYGFAAVRISGGAVGNVITDCFIHSCATGVFMRGENTRDNSIWRNRFLERGLMDAPWRSIKASEYPRQGTRIKAGRGTSVCYNDIDGYFDAVEADSWNSPLEYGINRDFDMMYNTIRNTGDDAFEPDGGGVNMRMHRNSIRNCFVAISLAPVERGPVYCTYNDMTYYFLMFKLNVGGCTSLGPAYVYHNSGYTLVQGRAYGGVCISFPGRGSIPLANKVFMNNVMVGKDMGVRSGRPGCVFDYNCYGDTGERRLSFTWDVFEDGAYRESLFMETLEEFRAKTGQEEHGIYADPGFVDTTGMGAVPWRRYSAARFSENPQAEDMSQGDMHLLPTSPCIDAGAVIRGINEDFEGAAPDMGAYEFGE